MTWPAKFDDPTVEALVLVPDQNAAVQDLGPFLSGKMMQTDILPHSALICAAEGSSPACGADGIVRFSFEGNAYGAENLKRFHEKCSAASGRLSHRSPSISYGSAHISQLKPVARYDMLRMTFVEVLDNEVLENWSAEETATYLPSERLLTPTQDPNVLQSLCSLPMRSLIQGKNGIFIWVLLDGTVLTMESAQKDSLTAHPRGDKELLKTAERSGLEISEIYRYIA